MNDDNLDAFVRGNMPSVTVSPARQRRLIAATLVRVGSNRVPSAHPRGGAPARPAMTWLRHCPWFALPLGACAALGMVIGATLGSGGQPPSLSYLIVSSAMRLTGF